MSDLTLHETEFFLVEGCHSCPLPGYLIVTAKNSAQTISAIRHDALLQLGPTLAEVISAIETVLKPVHVYCAQFGELGGTVHFHLFPRTQELTEDFLRDHPEHAGQLSGPALLEWARRMYKPTGPVPEATRSVNERIAKLLSKSEKNPALNHSRA